MTHTIQQRPRLGESRQPLPERWEYIKTARCHHPTRHAWQLSDDEVRQVRAMLQSDAVLYTIAHHFSIPIREVGKVARRPFRLRSEVPAAFETPNQETERRDWHRDEVNVAHTEAWDCEVNRAWTDAKREDKRRAKTSRQSEGR